MATDLKPGPDTSLTELVSGILHDAQELLKQQFAMLKQEIKEDLRKTLTGLMFVGVGAAFGLAGLILVTVMLVHLLHALVPSLPEWACWGIWGGIALLTSAALVYAGVHKFMSFNPLPDETAQALKENVQWITRPK